MNMKWFKKNPRRLSLKGWAVLEDLRKSIHTKSEEGEWVQVPSLIFEAIELTTGKVNRNMFWLDAMELYAKTIEINLPRKKFPLLTTKEKGKVLPWEYEGRGWYFWCNVFATRYGWSPDQIAVLDVDDAIGLYEEILIDRQMEDEWEWGLSEVAYSYDKAAKKSRLQKLPRPDWMRMSPNSKPVPVKTSLMPAVAIPQGVVINLDEN